MRCGCYTVWHTTLWYSTMKQIAEHLYARGKAGKLYCRVRIPSKLKAAYPLKKTHITRALGTSGCKEGKQLLVRVPSPAQQKGYWSIL